MSDIPMSTLDNLSTRLLLNPWLSLVAVLRHRGTSSSISAKPIFQTRAADGEQTMVEWIQFGDNIFEYLTEWYFARAPLAQWPMDSSLWVYLTGSTPARDKRQLAAACTQLAVSLRLACGWLSVGFRLATWCSGAGGFCRAAVSPDHGTPNHRSHTIFCRLLPTHVRASTHLSGTIDDTALEESMGGSRAIFYKPSNKPL